MYYALHWRREGVVLPDAATVLGDEQRRSAGTVLCVVRRALVAYP